VRWRMNIVALLYSTVMRRECSFFAMVMFLLAGLVFSSAIATMQAWRNARRPL
jgi:hypothetical protein